MSAGISVASRRLGSAVPSVFPIALGCMGMSGMYGPADQAESVATIHAALDAGVTLIDTGDYYSFGDNELLIGRALAGRRDKALLSVKFGALRAPDGSWLGMDARPAAVKNFLGYSLRRLGVDHVDIYRPGRFDPTVPIEETIGAIADMVKAGHVRAIGLSEVGPETIRRAQAVHPVSDLQIEYSLVSRGVETRILPVLRELRVGVSAYGVLSRGLLAGSAPSRKGDFRAYLPRFTGENRERNARLAEALRGIAAERGVPRRRSRSRGCSRRARTSSRSSALERGRSSRTRCGRSRFGFRRRTSLASRRPCPRRPSRGRATARIRCESWTARDESRKR